MKRMSEGQRNWTELEKQFDRIVRMSDSPNQVVRIDGRLQLDKFIQEHGREACDKMWEKIK